MNTTILSQGLLKNFEYLPLAQIFNENKTQALRNKTILITGANGLLGSHLLYHFLNLNHAHKLNLKIDALSKSPPNTWTSQMIREVREHDLNLTWHSVDLSSANFLDKIELSYDFIIHAATYGQPKKFIENPHATMFLNAETTKFLLDRCRDRFLFMSTSELYGSPGTEEAVHEKFPAKIIATDPRSVYTAAKLYAEVLCKTYNDLGKCTTRIARVSSVFGPGVNMHDDRVLNVFIMRALKDNKLKIQDPGLQRRKWLYIADAVRMFFHLLIDAKDLIYNVSGSEVRSIKEIAQIIANLTNVPCEIPDNSHAHSAHLKDALSLINMDNNKVLKEFEIDSLTSVEKGIANTIEWYKQIGSI